MDALQKAITGESTALTPTKGRMRRKPNNHDPSKLSAAIVSNTVSGNLSNYDTDDQTDQMMDMLVKSATAGERKTRIRKNRAKDSKSTRKSGKNYFLSFCFITIPYHTFMQVQTASYGERVERKLFSYFYRFLFCFYLQKYLSQFLE